MISVRGRIYLDVEELVFCLKYVYELGRLTNLLNIHSRYIAAVLNLFRSCTTRQTGNLSRTIRKYEVVSIYYINFKETKNEYIVKNQVLMQNPRLFEGN